MVAIMGGWGAARFSAFSAESRKVRQVPKEVLAKLQAGAPFRWPDAGAWLVRQNDGEAIVAFDDRCPHLGCRQEWNLETKLFECPCHGSEFDVEGKIRKGPAQKPMPRLQVKTEDGGGLRLVENH